MENDRITMTPSYSEHCGDWSLSEWSIIPISQGGSVSPKSGKAHAMVFAEARANCWGAKALQSRHALPLSCDVSSFTVLHKHAAVNMSHLCSKRSMNVTMSQCHRLLLMQHVLPPTHWSNCCLQLCGPPLSFPGAGALWATYDHEKPTSGRVSLTKKHSSFLMQCCLVVLGL